MELQFLPAHTCSKAQAASQPAPSRSHNRDNSSTHSSHCLLLPRAWVSKGSLRAGRLGWGLIADGVCRKGPGVSKHTQTFMSRSLGLGPVSRWLPWKGSGIAALSQQCGAIRNTTSKPFSGNVQSTEVSFQTHIPSTTWCLHPSCISQSHH